MKNSRKVEFLSFKCRVVFGNYSNGRIALELVEIKTKEPVLVATINVPMVVLCQNEVVIKNFSENEGILDVLIKAKVISEPIRFTETGFTNSPICKLL